MSEKVKVSPSGFRAQLGIEETRYSDADKRKSNPQLNLGRYGHNEATALLKSVVIPQDKNSPAYTGDLSQIISYLHPTHKNVGRRAKNMDKLAALAPEINQASIILPSSIMSPNDMQDGAFTFVFNDISAMDNDPDLANAVQEIYTNYFNDKMKLGRLCYEWLREALFRSGAKAILLVPTSVHSTLRNRTREDVLKDQHVAGLENFEEYCNSLNAGDDYFYSRVKLDWSDVFKSEDINSVISATAPAMESVVEGIPVEYSSHKDMTAIYGRTNKATYDAAMEAMIVNMRTKLEEGDVIRISENPEIIKFNVARAANALKRTDDALSRKYGTDSVDLPEERIIDLDSVVDGSANDFTACTLMDLPTESVIPICIPGVPNQHLGYFIMLDENGQPLTYDSTTHIGGFMEGDAVDANTAEAFAAMFGTGNNVIRFGSNSSAAVNAQKIVFNHFLDRYVRSRMKNLVPGDDLELSQFNSISSTMFARMMKNKKTTLVYAPPRLLHYLAFDYREDGTGKPRTENIAFLLSLRTTLLMANAIGSVNDAIDHKRIEFDAGEAAASKNLEQIMETIRGMYISKNSLSGSLDPGEILNNISTNALTIVPKNIEGLQNFSVEVSNSNSQSSRVDNDTIEFLTSSMITELDVPPPAIAQSSEAEFSRSIATNNLFFAKKIATYQATTNEFITQLIRSYTRFDSKFRKTLIDTVINNGKARVKDKVPEEVAKLAKNNPNKRSGMNQMISAIMDNVSTQLPKTNIVVDKAQFEEIRNYISNLDELANRIFDDELIAQDNQRASDGIRAMRARWKRDNLLELIGRIGPFNMATITDGDDLDPQDHIDFMQLATNYGSAMSAYSNIVNKAAEGEDVMGGGGGSNYSSGGSDDDDDGFGF